MNKVKADFAMARMPSNSLTAVARKSNNRLKVMKMDRIKKTRQTIRG